MIGELQPRSIGVRILEVDDYKLLVLVGRKKQRRVSWRNKSEDISVLCLKTHTKLAPVYSHSTTGHLHRCEQRLAAH